jgi:hypothetical protein
VLRDSAREADEGSGGDAGFISKESAYALGMGRLLLRTGHFERRNASGNSELTDLDHLLLAYVMTMDRRDEEEKAEADYRDVLFAHAFMSQNPDFYADLYPEVFGINEEAVEWQTDPEAFEDFVRDFFPDGPPE